MATSQAGSAIMILLLAIVSFYFLELTLGPVMDTIGYTFAGIYVPGMKVAWTSPALTMFGQFHRVIYVMLIAVGIWAVKTAVSENVYYRGRKGGF